ncbi:MAG TPA: tetratricopeptide repeat protein [Candidatus Baltobacteraceae bacterium]|nr:tetratricopeptide repeat protein [Candidatus Baltobacteraceae bacterium]
MSEPLAELLRVFRAAALLSQETLAERSGLSTRTVSDIETGSARTPRLVTVMLLAEALALTSDDRARLVEAARRPVPRQSGPAVTEPALRPPPLVGRDADVARLVEMLSTGGARLVTLVGPAGVGKTSLAMHVAAERAGAYELGEAVVELAQIEEPALVPAAVARALRIRESAEASASETVATYLRDRGALIVLDNLEHLTPAATWIAEVLAACPRLAILATSREALRLRAEYVYAVRPLDGTAAAALFTQRARMVKPDFELTAENAGAIETIVDHLEGLPLALELAAPRLLLLSPRALAARLERRLPLLGDGAVDRPQRQQTMHGAIAWSYDLLSGDEQRCFRRLGVLHGGGTLEAAAAIVGESGTNGEPSILFRLASLVDKNMLALDEDAEGEPRLSMLEMLREFAVERLGESGELDEVARRHADSVLAFVEKAERELSGASQGRWLARFEREHANIRAALQYAARRDETLLGLRLTAASWRFWWLHGHLTEGLGWVRRFLQLRAASPQSASDVLYGRVLRANVVLLSALGNFDEALESCEEAIALQRAGGDDAGLGASLTSLGIIMQFRGQYDRANAAHEESLTIRRRLHDDAGIATSLSNLSSIAFSRNDLARAGSLGEESVAIYRRLGHESGLAHALTKIGLVAAAQKNYDRADELFTECLRMQRAVGNLGSVHYSLENLGAVAHRRGETQRALGYFHEALALLDSMPNKAALAKTLEDLAPVIAAAGDAARGARLFGAADALRRAIGSPLFPAERADYETEVDAVRAKLGAEAFDAQWSIGKSITLERALEEARETRSLL